MISSYRLGLAIVAGTILLTAALVLALVDLDPPGGRAADDLGARPNALGAFRLVDRSGREVTQADTAGDVWIASFVFTRCRTSCPRIAAVVRDLQGRLDATGVRLVSLTVDPDHDTPAVLDAFADRYRADPERWWFLTGTKAEVYRLILERFQLMVGTSPPEALAGGAEAVGHSTRLALVDRGNLVVGYFDADDPEAVRRLEARARQLDLDWMPALNAVLNGLGAVLLTVGWTAIRSGRLKRHIGSMIAALIASALFLVSYLVYHYLVGTVRFRGVGPARFAYLTILGSHTVLATAIVPLVALTLSRAARRRFEAHARIARVTFPIWLYVSITGVVVYLMLYQLPVFLSDTSI